MFQILKTLFSHMPLRKKISTLLTIAIVIYLSVFIFSFLLTIFAFITGVFLIKALLDKFLGKEKSYKVKSYHYKNGIEKEIIEINPEDK